jgi:hypothetical protein
MFFRTFNFDLDTLGLYFIILESHSLEPWRQRENENTGSDLRQKTICGPNDFKKLSFIIREQIFYQ